MRWSVACAQDVPTSSVFAGVEGVEAVDVDLESKVVTIHGERLSDEALREAIEEAGYEAA